VKKVDSIISFIKDYWVIIAIVLVVIFILNFLVNTLIKLVLFALFVGVILVVGFHYQPDEVINLGKHATSAALQQFHATLEPILEEELSQAKTTFHPDGTYEMKTKNLRITGKKGSDEAVVYVKNQTFHVKLSDLGEKVQTLLSQQQRNL